MSEQSHVKTLGAALKQTLGWLCERADNGRVEVEDDEFGVVFEMYEDGTRMVGTIDETGKVTWL